MRTNIGADWQSAALGGDTLGDFGTSTGVTATTLTDSGKGWVVNTYAGHLVVSGTAYGVIASNTATAVTFDRWSIPGDPGGGAASTPSTGSYVILSGNHAAYWMALSTDATAPGVTDTTLTGEINHAGGGLNRAPAIFGHTTGAASYTLTKTFTANSNDGPVNTVQKTAIFNASSGGRMPFEAAVTNPPVMQSGDQTTFTATVTI